MSPSLKLSELYTSIQGEGPLVGEPTQFVRFGGCNMRCPFWGEHTLPDGTTVGACDTPYAVYPQYRKDWTAFDPSELADGLAEWPKHLCITGGEPFMQPLPVLERFIKEVLERDYSVEFFTNGTLQMPQWAFKYSRAITLDWKLEGSGEGLKVIADNKKVITRDFNFKNLTGKDAIKFTVTGPTDLDEALDWYDDIKDWTGAQFYVGGVWGKIADKEITDFVQRHSLPWKLNLQTHKFIFDPDARGI